MNPDNVYAFQYDPARIFIVFDEGGDMGISCWGEIMYLVPRMRKSDEAEIIVQIWDIP
jgi:hypothetical protein